MVTVKSNVKSGAYNTAVISDNIYCNLPRSVNHSMSHDVFDFTMV